MSEHNRSNVALNDTVDLLWSNALAKRTKTAYDTGYRHLLNFLVLNGYHLDVNSNPHVISEEMLIDFTAHCFKNLQLQYSTIKLYLAGIRFKCLQENISSPFLQSDLHMQRLPLILNSVKRLQKPVTRSRLPLTYDIVRKLCLKLRSGVFSYFIDRMLQCACIIAFYGFLRCGEFTVYNENFFDPDSNLCIADVSFTQDYAILHLKQSKTDPFRKGVDIQLHKLSYEFCPYKILKEYLILRKRTGFSKNSDPLFINELNKPLDRPYFIKKLKFLLTLCGYDPDVYSGHSFSDRCCTSAGKSKIEDHLIKTLGRWNSDSYCRYIRTCKSSIKQAQLSMSNKKDS